MPKDHNRVFYDPIRQLTNPHISDHTYISPSTHMRAPLLPPPISYPVVGPRRDYLLPSSYEPYPVRLSPDREYGKRRQLFKYLEED